MPTNSADPHYDATVVINAYQQAPTLDLALHALADQDFTGMWEIIAVDDGSSDDTGAVVTNRADQTDVPVLYVRLPDRGNRWSLARNLGIRLSRGRIVIFLDADMVPDRDVVRLHVEQQRREPSLVAGNRLWRNAAVDLAGTSTVGDQLERLRARAESGDPVHRKRQAVETRFRHELIASKFPWRAWFGCHVSLPADSAVRFDEAMAGWGPSDIELACRVYQQHGLPVRYLHHACAWHIEREGAYHNPFRTADTTAATEYVRQICYMIRKHPELDLAEVIDMGFDRLVLDPDGRWRTVPRGQGADRRKTLVVALDWYARSASPSAPG